MADQKSAVKTVPLSEAIDLGKPNLLTICATKTSANSGASIVFLVGMYLASLVYRSITTRIESYASPLPPLGGNSTMKSVVRSNHGHSGIGSDCSSPNGFCLVGLMRLHIVQLRT